MPKTLQMINLFSLLNCVISLVGRFIPMFFLNDRHIGFLLKLLCQFSHKTNNHCKNIRLDQRIVVLFCDNLLWNLLWNLNVFCSTLVCK